MTLTEPPVADASLPTAADRCGGDGPGFAAELRGATTSDHMVAEGGEFLGALFEGSFVIGDYIGLAVAHLSIYEALESAAERLRDHPIAGPFIDNRLHRRHRLRADLAVLAARHPEGTPGPAVLAYRDRIAQSCEENPALFVAHHYTRYLGDLSGGLMIHRKLVEELPELAAATSFYDFAALGELGAYKTSYRSLLDAAPLSCADRVAVIDEVRIAYRCNVAVFVELHRQRNSATA